MKPSCWHLGLAVERRRRRVRRSERARRRRATFKSGVDLVRVSAVVRDRRAGSCRISRRGTSRSSTAVSAATHLGFPARLDRRQRGAAVRRQRQHGRAPAGRARSGDARSELAGRDDEAAVFTFDTGSTRSRRSRPACKTLPESMSTVAPFGATSLHDAIARTAERVGRARGPPPRRRGLHRRHDNASRLTADRSVGIASAIDVPVYIFGSCRRSTTRRPRLRRRRRSSRRSRAAERSRGVDRRPRVRREHAGPAQPAARQIVDELRHQYLIAFESSGKPGWHPLVVRARNKDLVVRARSGYIAGQSRPIRD